MKKHSLVAAATCIVVIAVGWAAWPEPASDREWAYQKLKPFDYRLLHGDAWASLPPRPSKALSSTRAMLGRRLSRSGVRALW